MSSFQTSYPRLLGSTPQWLHVTGPPNLALGFLHRTLKMLSFLIFRQLSIQLRTCFSTTSNSGSGTTFVPKMWAEQMIKYRNEIFSYQNINISIFFLVNLFTVIKKINFMIKSLSNHAMDCQMDQQFTLEVYQIENFQCIMP